MGLPFARFLAYPTYEWDASQNVWKPQSAYPMYELKPERTNSWEVGLTMRFLKHRWLAGSSLRRKSCLC